VKTLVKFGSHGSFSSTKKITKKLFLDVFVREDENEFFSLNLRSFEKH
jgi:hypothetical protein